MLTGACAFHLSRLGGFRHVRDGENVQNLHRAENVQNDQKVQHAQTVQNALLITFAAGVTPLAIVLLPLKQLSSLSFVVSFHRRSHFMRLLHTL